MRAYEQGRNSIAEIAARFGVGPTFVKKMLRQHRETGDLTERPHGGGRPASLSLKQRRLLQQKVQREQDISLSELQAYLQETADSRDPRLDHQPDAESPELAAQKKD